MKTFKIRDNCVGFAGQHEFKTSQAGNGGERVLMGCRSDVKRCIWETRSRVQDGQERCWNSRDLGLMQHKL